MAKKGMKDNEEMDLWDVMFRYGGVVLITTLKTLKGFKTYKQTRALTFRICILD